jgi:hypothetical protein
MKHLAIARSVEVLSLWKHWLHLSISTKEPVLANVNYGAST